MSPGKDFIPYSLSAVAGLMRIFAAQLPDLAAKYGVAAVKSTRTQAIFNAKLQEKQLTDFVGEIVRESTAQKSVYIQNDGELLCINAPDETCLSHEVTAPELNLRTAPNYKLEIEFRKMGMEIQLRVETKQKGGDWQLATIITKSPATINIIPLAPGEAEQIEVRGVFLEKNLIFGNYSPTYNAVVQP